jgi:predicted transcriptional regulator
MSRRLVERRRVLSAQVEPATAERLEQLAQRADRTLSSEIRRALREHIARETPVSTLDERSARR